MRIRKCCPPDAATLVNSARVRKHFHGCPRGVANFYIDTPEVACDPATGEPCPGLCVGGITCLGACVTSYDASLGDYFLRTLGKGKIEIDFTWSATADPSADCPEQCPGAGLPNVVRARIAVSVTRVDNGAPVTLNASLNNMVPVPGSLPSGNSFEADNLEMGGGALLSLDFDDHANPDNQGIWEKGQKYKIQISGGISAAYGDGGGFGPTCLKSFGNDGLVIELDVSSSCYIGGVNEADVDPA